MDISTAQSDTPHKILLYTHALAGGGAERALALLASGLTRRGHAVTLATDYGAAENDCYLDARVRLVELDANHAKAVLALTRLLRDERFDITVSALGASNLKHTLAACLAGRRRRAVISYHGFFDAEPRFLSRLSFWLTPVTTRIVGRAVAVSLALRTNLVDVWRADAARTIYVQNPVAFGPPAVAPTETALRAREKIVLACGRLNAGKNFVGLLRAFAQVEPQTARLVILGEGEDRAHIEAEIARLGLGARVELPGYVAKPWDWYEKAACLAVSSLSESFGMVIVEALAHGLPVVSTDCGGTREVLDNGRIGALVPIGDEDALAAGISRALADPGDPAPRLQRAQEYSIEASVSAYEALFASMLAGVN